MSIRYWTEPIIKNAVLVVEDVGLIKPPRRLLPLRDRVDDLEAPYEHTCLVEIDVDDSVVPTHICLRRLIGRHRGWWVCRLADSLTYDSTCTIELRTAPFTWVLALGLVGP